MVTSSSHCITTPCLSKQELRLLAVDSHFKVRGRRFEYSRGKLFDCGPFAVFFLQSCCSVSGIGQLLKSRCIFESATNTASLLSKYPHFISETWISLEGSKVLQ